MVKEDYFTEKNIYKKTRKFIQKLNKLYYFPKIDFDINTSALLVIDMQRYFLDKNSHAFLPSSKAIIPNIKKLIKFFRKKKDL
uniref:Isochorismatase family protein n=1 Tax=candidate division WOR-3 bacterium TaxID=2052148 RepID=A0A7V0Z6J3_UNCW3